MLEAAQQSVNKNIIPSIHFLKGVSFLLIVLLATNVYAHTLSVKVTDYYTSLPIENANISLLNRIDNTSLLDDDLTNADGWGVVATTTTDYHYVIIRKSDYQDSSFTYDIQGDNESYQSLFPISYGIIKVIYDDLSRVGSDELIILMTDHDRILGKYNNNDTIILGNIVNYTIKSRGNPNDAFTNPSMIQQLIESNAYLFIIALGICGLFIGGLIIAAGFTSVNG